MGKPLQGIRVLDFSRVLAGPYCSMILGDLGAEVIKVEREHIGDDLRAWGPPFMPDGESTYFLSVNRNKRSITLDLKTESGQQVARELARTSDIVLENFRLGTMEKLRLSYETLRGDNPALIYCSISGYGTRGPLKDRPGYDIIAQGISGLMSVTGEIDGHPMRVGVAIADMVTGLYAAVAILGALQSRQSSGEGQKIDLSLLESSLAIMPNLTAGYLMTGNRPKRQGNGHPNTVPYKTFPTHDGYLILAIGNEPQWKRFCAAVGHPEFGDNPLYASNADRVARRDEIDALICDWLKHKTTDEWISILEEAEVPSGPIYTVDRVLNDPQVEALNLIRNIAHPTSGELSVVGPPYSMSVDGTEPYLPPPLLGEHSVQILTEILGKNLQEIEALNADGAFGEEGLTNNISDSMTEVAK